MTLYKLIYLIENTIEKVAAAQTKMMFHCDILKKKELLWPLFTSGPIKLLEPRGATKKINKYEKKFFYKFFISSKIQIRPLLKHNRPGSATLPRGRNLCSNDSNWNQIFSDLDHDYKKAHLSNIWTIPRKK